MIGYDEKEEKKKKKRRREEKIIISTYLHMKRVFQDSKTAMNTECLNQY
jgi:hypothetical protein